MRATIRLFNAVPISSKRKKADKELTKKTVPLGFVFSPEVIYNYPDTKGLIKEVEEIIGMSGEKANVSFHKSWQRVKNTPYEHLVVEQLAHYLTTYGKESGFPEEYIVEKGEQWGVEDLPEKINGLTDFNQDYIYIPKEKLEIPDIDIDEIRLTIIKGYTKDELKEKLLNLLSSGIALKEETISDVVEVAIFTEVDENDIEKIKNKEVKIALYDYLDIVPENNVEFLRYVIYKITGQTLIIKSPALIAKIKENQEINVRKLFAMYQKKHGLERLAEIFYRFKPLWLAMRINSNLKKTINKIRRLAEKHHKPMPIDFLNTITAQIAGGKKINSLELEKELSRVNIFRKIRLAYALKFRTHDVDSILYRIRNGKGYAAEFSFDKKDYAKRILDVVLTSIIGDISKNVKGKKIYIPDYITYTLPATEKQFTGNLPSGSYISIPKDMVFGIYWDNVKGNRIDLDLAMMSNDEKIGWDGIYRNDNGNILFSGDITDAEAGATELFYVKRQVKQAYILFVNYYNFDKEMEVLFKIMIAKEEVKDFKQNYMVNPNNIIAVTNSVIKEKQRILGLVVITTSECRFYFAETAIGVSITSRKSKYTEHSRKYLFDFYENTISLNDILMKSGAKIVREKEKADINLSPESLERNSILELIR